MNLFIPPTPPGGWQCWVWYLAEAPALNLRTLFAPALILLSGFLPQNSLGASAEERGVLF